MGFFRFRRSIKIFPGVRWNFGKRSSSVSLGGRGFHYTIGTHGTRTTVGLPGSGLSYTSVNAAHRTQQAPTHPISVEKALEWGRKQQETFHFEVPDKEPDEESATQTQIDQIHELVKGIQGLNFDTLGKRQAAAVISAIKAEKDQFTDRKVQEYLVKQKGGSGCLILFCVALIVFVAFVLMGIFAGK